MENWNIDRSAVRVREGAMWSAISIWSFCTPMIRTMRGACTQPGLVAAPGWPQVTCSEKCKVAMCGPPASGPLPGAQSGVQGSPGSATSHWTLTISFDSLVLMLIFCSSVRSNNIVIQEAPLKEAELREILCIWHSPISDVGGSSMGSSPIGFQREDISMTKWARENVCLCVWRERPYLHN